jgi:hypothetical protein
MTYKAPNHARVDGLRNATWLVREAAEFAEKHPDMSAPRIAFNAYEDDGLHYHVYAYGYDAADRIAAQMQTIQEFYPGLEWVANDPSKSTHDREMLYLRANHRGAVITIFTSRDKIGEFVNVIEAGPQVIETEDGTMQAIRQTVTMWKPNPVLAALSRPGFELGAAPSVKVLTA